MIEISGNGALLVSLLCVVGVCAHALKSQWVACMNLVQAWWAGEQQQELKKNTDAENLVVLSVSIMVKWLRFTWGKMKGLSWQKMYWNCKHSDEWLRLTESGGIWYYKTCLCRKNQIIRHLWHFASFYSIDTPLQFLLPLIYTLLWRAWVTWLSDPQNTYLVSFFFFSTIWFISIIFQLTSIWFFFFTLGFGQRFFSIKKKIHTISQSLYQTYALMRQKESQWWFLSHSKKYNTFMHCIVGIYRKFAICYGKTESVDEDGKWDPWNLYSTYHI